MVRNINPLALDEVSYYDYPAAGEDSPLEEDVVDVADGVVDPDDPSGESKELDARTDGVADPVIDVGDSNTTSDEDQTAGTTAPPAAVGKD